MDMEIKFIELTLKETGIKMIGNINLLQRVIDKGKDGCMIVGWNNNGGILVTESYIQIKRKFENAKITIL